MVHEAVGPPLTPGAAAACLAVGVNSLLVAGVLPVLLGSLVDEGRLDAPGLGRVAMTELLAMGLATAAMGLIKTPRRIRLISVCASVGMTLACLATLVASGAGIFAARAAAGAMEGVLLWVTVSMIARTVTPERWAAVFFTGQVLGQLALAGLMAAWLVPRWGANGGYAALAGAGIIGLLPALKVPNRFAPLASASGQSGAPPFRGWVALAFTLIYVCGSGAVYVYIAPLAHQAGLSSQVVRTGQWVFLAAQVVGGVVATLLAGRVRYFAVMVFSTAVYLVFWALLTRPMTASAFIGGYAIVGFAALVFSSFLTPMIIDSDPSRRAAMQSGAAQVLGGALGPLLASLAVRGGNVHGVLFLGGGFVLVGLAGIAALRFTALRPR